MDNEPTYDVDYFIEKFEAIPHREWYGGGDFQSPSGKSRCVQGHCGLGVGPMPSGAVQNVAKSIVALSSLFEFGRSKGVLPRGGGVTHCNDGDAPYGHYAKTPKRRILKALRAIKAAQASL